MQRVDGRSPLELRKVNITRNYTKYAEGSVLVEMGDTKVICTASIEEKVPSFLRNTGQGWVTAEYAMLPRATETRNVRESSIGKPSGRTQEIQRLVGRVLRSVVDLKALGERTIWIDCDVIQADGGTRTASITGAFICLVDALALITPANEESNRMLPVFDFLAAVSVGIVDKEILLDLCFKEDSVAQVDMNVVMTAGGRLVEVQGTAEQYPFTRNEMYTMFDCAEAGIKQLVEIQKSVLGDLALRVGKGQCGK